jgi:hypothetical protein
VRATRSVHLSRLRGRSARSLERGGWGNRSASRLCGGTPTPALPRKRERERPAGAEALNQFHRSTPYPGATILVRSDIRPSNAITMSSPGFR